MPAPAVIPAPIAYIIDVAVETFVVELYLLNHSIIDDDRVFSAEIMQEFAHVSCVVLLYFTLSESACSTQANCLERFTIA